MGRDFTTARTILGFVELICWIAFVIGVLMAIAGGGAASRGFGGGTGLLAALPGMAVALISLLAIVMVQGSRAQVETAQMTSKILSNSEAQLREMQRVAHAGASGGRRSLPPAAPQLQTAASPAAAPPTSSSAEQPSTSVPRPPAAENSAPKSLRPVEPPLETVEYRGVAIDKFGSGVFIGDLRFHGMFSAEGYIDRILEEGGQLPAPKT